MFISSVTLEQVFSTIKASVKVWPKTQQNVRKMESEKVNEVNFTLVMHVMSESFWQRRGRWTKIESLKLLPLAELHTAAVPKAGRRKWGDRTAGKRGSRCKIIFPNYIIYFGESQRNDSEPWWEG